MLVRVPRLTFRNKVVLLTLALVLAVQVMLLLPVLRETNAANQRQIDASAERAGSIYDRYISSRADLIGLGLESLTLEPAFAESLVAERHNAIQGRLLEYASRAGVETAAVFDAEGNDVASIGAGRGLWPNVAARSSIYAAEPRSMSSIVLMAGQPYLAVTAPVEAAATTFLVTFALPVDVAFVRDIEAMTGTEVSVVSFGVGSKTVYATTLDDQQLESAMAQVQLGISRDGDASLEWADGWVTNLRPFLPAMENLYVALQVTDTKPFFSLTGGRYWLLAGFVLSLILTLIVATRLSNLVTDRLTHSVSGLPTRESIVGEIGAAILGSHRIAIVNLALHRLDELASTLGHHTTDQLIRLAASKLCDQLADSELLAHLDLQEFVLVLPGATVEEAKSRVNALQTLLRSGIAVGNANIALQMRAGIAMYPQDAIDPSELLRCAGIARGNASHRLGSVGIYELRQEERTLELIQIVGDFPRALQERELWLEYQPKITCNTLMLCGAEALVRWHHPKLGRLPPDVFVAAIERAGGVSQLTRWVLEEAVLALVSWSREGLETSISVNISADDLIDGYLPPYLERLCNRHAVEPGSLTLEVTESSIMHDVEGSLAVIAAVRELGCRVSIDDFGTGHSALAQLKRIPVDELKIDKSFVLRIEDQRDEAVVRTAIELGHKFGLSVVAEGVEDEICLIRLQQLGCEAAQGFYFSKSLPIDAFVAWAKSWASGGGADIVALVGDSGGSSRSRA